MKVFLTQIMRGFSNTFGSPIGWIAAIGSGMASLWGGWSKSLQVLLIFMVLDYATGLIVAGVFKGSPKTEHGALESRAGWKGLIRKGFTLVMVMVAHQLDQVIGLTIVRDMTCIAFVANEVISITENVGKMGVDLPPIITNAIEILKKKGSDEQIE